MKNRSGLGCKLQLVCLLIHSLKKDLCQVLAAHREGLALWNIQAGLEMRLESPPGTRHCSSGHSPGIASLSTPGPWRWESPQSGLSSEEAQMQAGEHLRHASAVGKGQGEAWPYLSFPSKTPGVILGQTPRPGNTECCIASKRRALRSSYLLETLRVGTRNRRYLYECKQSEIKSVLQKYSVFPTSLLLLRAVCSSAWGWLVIHLRRT